MLTVREGAENVDKASEVVFLCPKCGSPYVAGFKPGDARMDAIENFICTAGDCTYVGHGIRLK